MSKDSNLFSEDFNDVATHLVIIDFEDAQQQAFEAIREYSDKYFRLYKVEDGETYDETFVEVGDGFVNVLLDGEEYNLDILDSAVDGPNIHLWCENDSCYSIEIDANCILTDTKKRSEIAESFVIDDDYDFDYIQELTERANEEF